MREVKPPYTTNEFFEDKKTHRNRLAMQYLIAALDIRSAIEEVTDSLGVTRSSSFA